MLSPTWKTLVVPDPFTFLLNSTFMELSCIQNIMSIIPPDCQAGTGIFLKHICRSEVKRIQVAQKEGKMVYLDNEWCTAKWLSKATRAILKSSVCDLSGGFCDG